MSESGQVFEYSAGGWNEETTETGQNLRAVETGDPNVAVLFFVALLYLGLKLLELYDRVLAPAMS